MGKNIDPHDIAGELTDEQPPVCQRLGTVDEEQAEMDRSWLI
jgi:hypothetical protein